LAEARVCLGDDIPALILIDQEGGRVQRLTSPHWPKYPAAKAFGEMHRQDPGGAVAAARLCARAMAQDLWEAGINTSCAPVLDLTVPGADNVIGDRAYGADVAAVIELAGAVAEGLLAGGVLPVIKHIPGHGRAMADSHFALPVVTAPYQDLRVYDFAPFRALRHLPLAMTAHVAFTAVDAETPVTISRRAIEGVIRDDIGFDGLLLSDDLSMHALSGTLEARARRSFEAGCDLALHCNGRMDEMLAVGEASPFLEGDALRRFEAALGCLRNPEPFDLVEAEDARLRALAILA
jgi:beta-N-acetylhexosaminidase